LLIASRTYEENPESGIPWFEVRAEPLRKLGKRLPLPVSELRGKTSKERHW
jgi:hypothetical protein